MKTPLLRKNFVLSVRGTATSASARDTLKRYADIEIIRAHNTTFLVRTTQRVADDFAAAHKDWVVAAERFIPRPRATHLRIKKGPE